jgi:hypothetical protein
MRRRICRLNRPRGSSSLPERSLAVYQRQTPVPWVGTAMMSLRYFLTFLACDASRLSSFAACGGEGTFSSPVGPYLVRPVRRSRAPRIAPPGRLVSTSADPWDSGSFTLAWTREGVNVTDVGGVGTGISTTADNGGKFTVDKRPSGTGAIVLPPGPGSNANRDPSRPVGPDGHGPRSPVIVKRQQARTSIFGAHSAAGSNKQGRRVPGTYPPRFDSSAQVVPDSPDLTVKNRRPQPRSSVSRQQGRFCSPT